LSFSFGQKTFRVHFCRWSLLLAGVRQDTKFGESLVCNGDEDVIIAVLLF
ncbi:hypothetical protein SDJN02_11460, partial [Cucurbita argyrosperma subsp. argyrosperma]